MDTRQVLGFLLVLAGLLWLFAIRRRSDEKALSESPDAPNSDQGWSRSLNSVAERLPNRFLPGVILLIIGALLLVPWNNVLGSQESGPCCPPGAQSESEFVMVASGRSQI